MSNAQLHPPTASESKKKWRPTTASTIRRLVLDIEGRGRSSPGDRTRGSRALTTDLPEAQALGRRPDRRVVAVMVEPELAECERVECVPDHRARGFGAQPLPWPASRCWRRPAHRELGKETRDHVEIGWVAEVRLESRLARSQEH